MLRIGRLLTTALAIALSAASAALAQDEASNITPYAPTFFSEFRPNTARDMIGRLPGFSFDGGTSERGFAGAAGNVLIDGERPPSRGDSLSDVLGRIPASAVERIDVIRGGAPGIDMQGKAIVANVIRKKTGGVTGSASAGVGTDEWEAFNRDVAITAQRQIGGRVIEGKLEYNFFGEGDEGLREQRLADGTLIEQATNTGRFNYEEIAGSGSFETTLLGGRLRANAQVKSVQDDNRGAEILIFPSGATQFQSHSDELSGETGLRFSRTLPAGFDMEAVAFQSYATDDSGSDNVRPAFRSGSISENTSGESIGSVTFHSPAYGKWKFDAGTELAFNFTESALFRTIDGEPLSLDGDESRVEELRSDSRLVATWRPSQTFNLEGGVRYERSTISAGPIEKTLSFIKPRLNMSWTPKAGHQFNLRLERTVDQLSFDAFESSVSFSSNLDNTVFGVGNNDLEPAHQWVLDGRYERRWGRDGVFVIQVVHRRIDDFVSRTIVAAPTPGEPDRVFEITRNVGEAEQTHVTVSSTIPLDKLQFSGGRFSFSTTFRNSEIIDPVVPSLVRRISGESPFGWNLTLSQNIQSRNFSWAVYVNGDFEATNYSPRSIFSFENTYRTGANLSWKMRPDLTLGAGVNNINRGAGTNHLVFYTAPRNTGVPLFVEDGELYNVRSVFVNLRKDFR